MSISIEFHDGNGGRTEGQEVATNRGWVEFGAWVETLKPVKRYEKLWQLWEHGFNFNPSLTKKCVLAGLKAKPPQPNVRSVAENLIHLIDQAGDTDGIWVSDDS